MKRGFTLIETIVYLALYSIIISGAVVSVYHIAQSADRSRSEAMLHEEGMFLIFKVRYLLAHADSIRDPATQGSVLVVQEGSTQTSLYLSGAHLMIREGIRPVEILNNDNTGLTALTFVHAAPHSIITVPESLHMSFALSATSSVGRPITREFSTTIYVHQ